MAEEDIISRNSMRDVFNLFHDPSEGDYMTMKELGDVRCLLDSYALSIAMLGFIVPRDCIHLSRLVLNHVSFVPRS